MRRYTVLTIVIVSLAAVVLLLRQPRTYPGPSVQTDIPVPSVTPAPKPELPFVLYTAPKLPKKHDYTVVFLGDSMTAALGPYTDLFRKDIEDKYLDVGLIVRNESAPASNVASLQDRLLSKSTESGALYDAVLSKSFDIIVIESFGYNPLSYLGTTEGIDKANESLKTAMRILVRERPNSLIVFLATIAPSHTMYGVGEVKLTPAQRNEWATERDLYIENHIKFAKDHNIPLVDVYHLTKDRNGSGLLKYIEPQYHIHPSQLGVNLIEDQLANYFIQAKVFE